MMASVTNHSLRFVAGALACAFVAALPRFAVGAVVVARNAHPTGHTRLPRYARGKRGVIAAQRGYHVFPDAHAHGQGRRRVRSV